MKRGQPQCVLSVDISTCVDTISSLVTGANGRRGVSGWEGYLCLWILGVPVIPGIRAVFGVLPGNLHVSQHLRIELQLRFGLSG